MSWSQRQELIHILHWTKQPVKDPFELHVKFCVRCFLNNMDAQAELESTGIPTFVAKRAADRARMILGNERAARRSKAKEILAYRGYGRHEFTHENFRVKIDTSQDRNYGMAKSSIYCVVEVWLDEDSVEKEYLVNFSDYLTKEWLTKLLVWGLMNKREILIKPATKHEMDNMMMFVPKEKESI